MTDMNSIKAKQYKDRDLVWFKYDLQLADNDKTVQSFYFKRFKDGTHTNCWEVSTILPCDHSYFSDQIYIVHIGPFPDHERISYIIATAMHNFAEGIEARHESESMLAMAAVRSTKDELSNVQA